MPRRGLTRVQDVGVLVFRWGETYGKDVLADKCRRVLESRALPSCNRSLPSYPKFGVDLLPQFDLLFVQPTERTLNSQVVVQRLWLEPLPAKSTYLRCAGVFAIEGAERAHCFARWWRLATLHICHLTSNATIAQIAATGRAQGTVCRACSDPLTPVSAGRLNEDS